MNQDSGPRSVMTRDDEVGEAGVPSRPAPASRAAARFRVQGNAIVTGRAGDLSQAACRALLEHGLQGLMLFDLDPAGAAAAKVQSLQAEFPSARVRFAQVDVTDAAAVDEAVARAALELGSVDHLVALAGMVGCQHAVDTTPKEWNRILDVNTTGVFLCAQGTGGSLTFIASSSAHRVNYPQPQVAYNVSKAGVVALAKSLADEWATHGIRVNSVSPGYMDTVLNEGIGLDVARNVWLSHNPMRRMG
ncbi:putative dehydrogenases with different specificities (related to short-chain alcohol dehydrogenases) [Apiospora phragmitis]|uniref:Dehydrogenases with different specificities (Related to short-chain alcohol dehydrogenases) n=1 Tax=Apiospora phragmitis TaxID=2905665 RepID=A0ABR1UZP6_9PEZI